MDKFKKLSRSTIPLTTLLTASLYKYKNTWKDIHMALRRRIRRGRKPRARLTKRRRVVRAKTRSRQGLSKGATRARIGLPVRHKALDKRLNTNSGTYVLQSTRNLNWQDIFSNCFQGSELQQRERQAILLKGFSISLVYSNVLSSALYVNVAILHTKDEQYSANIPQTNFFRSDGNAGGAATAADGRNSRTRDFNLNCTAEQLHRLPINPDKFNVLAHKRFSLMRDSSGAVGFNNTQGRAYNFRNFWVPVKRRIVFDSATAGSPVEDRFLLMWWYDVPNTQTGAAMVPAAATSSSHVVAYFTDLP